MLFRSSALGGDGFAGNGQRDVCSVIAAERFPFGNDGLDPLGVLRQGKIGVRLVGKFAPSVGELVGGGWLAAVLLAERMVGQALDAVHGLHEQFFEVHPFGIVNANVKGVPQEIIGTGIFVQSAN